MLTMKKMIFSLLAGFACIGMTTAQESCMALFPNTQGTTWTTKCYDAQDNLLGKTTYVVTDYSENMSGPDTRINFTVIDTMGVVLNQGELNAHCTNGDFFMRSVSQPMDTDITRMISTNVNLLGSFLNYPDTFSSNFPYNSVFDMDGGQFTIEPKGDRKDFVRVRVYNRSYDKNERITTPAGSFDASKITYNVEVYNNENKETKTFRNTEWYALGHGIIRSEAHDSNNNLVNYTVLSTFGDLTSDN